MPQRRSSAGKSGIPTSSNVRNSAGPGWLVNGASPGRTAIAIFAAKLIAEGLTDYKAAKQKAARQLGLTNKQDLPDNLEVEAALRDHLALFHRDTQPRALAALRESALRLLAKMDQFSPSLVGPVLAGTANEFSEIELELVGIEGKSLEMYLLKMGVAFQLSESRMSAKNTAHHGLMLYHLEFAGLPVSITLYRNQAERHAAHPPNSIKHDRVGLAEALRRFPHVETKR